MMQKIIKRYEMKSKGIFFILFVSILLNIFHDFTISQQVSSQMDIQVQYSEKKLVSLVSNECNSIDDLHHFFHFSAIIFTLEKEISLLLENRPLFISINPPFLTFEPFRKPPKL